MRILLADNDRTNARGITFALKQAHMVADIAETGAETIDMAKRYDYDAIIMDVVLPDADGCDVVRRLRAMKNAAPILILSAQCRAEQKIKGLQAGADDYMAKPFDPQELLARLQAIIRRSKGFSHSRLELSGITMDLSAREVAVDALPVPLTSKEYAILELLVLRRGAVLSKENFLDHLYGGMDEPDSKIIDVFICKLRKKLAIAGADNLIGTVWGRGYIVRDQQMQRSTAPTRAAASRQAVPSQMA
jgi:two-component system cell cycle response regulator CtrA